jgi:hypothetical protein
LGTAVFSGMLGVTLFGVFLTPVFFYTIDWLGGTRLFASRAMQWLGELPRRRFRPLGQIHWTKRRKQSKPVHSGKDAETSEPALHE